MANLIRRVATSRLSRSARTENRTAFLADAGVHAAAVDRLEVTWATPHPEVAGWLGIEEGHPVLRRRRRYLLETTPVQLATSWIPGDLARGTAMEQPDTGPGGIYARLEEAGHRIASYDEEVSARVPTPDEIQQLDIEADVPVIRVLRYARGDTRVLEVSDAVLRSDRYVLLYSIEAR
jgi:GntR family transcriptional regulator